MAPIVSGVIDRYTLCGRCNTKYNFYYAQIVCLFVVYSPANTFVVVVRVVTKEPFGVLSVPLDDKHAESISAPTVPMFCFLLLFCYGFETLVFCR
jgi:hypothetical protein